MMGFRSAAVIFLVLLQSVGTVRSQAECEAVVASATEVLTEAQTLLEAGETSLVADSLEAIAAELRAGCVESDALPETSVQTEGSNGIGGSIQAPETSATDSLAFVRFVHAGTDVGPIDIYAASLGDVPLVSDLAFGQFTDLVRLPTGSYSFEVYPKDAPRDGAPLSTLNWDLNRRTSWLVAAIGLVENISFALEPISILRDQIGDQARVRVINTIVDYPTVTVDAINQDINFGEGLGWLGMQDLEVAPRAYQLEVTSGREELIGTTEVTVDAQTFTMVIAAGRVGSDHLPQLLVVPTFEATTRVRFINERTDAVSIYSQPGATELYPRILSGDTTAFISLPSGAYTLTAYVPNTGTTGRQLTSFIGDLLPDRDMTLTMSADGTTTITEVEFLYRG